MRAVREEAHQQPGGVLLGPDLNGLAQRHIRREGDRCRQHCARGRAGAAAPSQPPFYVPPLVPAHAGTCQHTPACLACLCMIIYLHSIKHFDCTLD
jgi:hypothetical protein